MDPSPSSSSSSFRHVRSISLPTRLHPSTLQVEEELSYLQTWEASSSSSMATLDTICGSLIRLERLYTSIHDLFSLPHNQQTFFYRKNDKLVDEFLDGLISLLDVCGSLKEAMEHVKEHLRTVQSALRRKKEDLKVDASSVLKKMKDANRTMAALKKIHKKMRSTDKNDDQFSELIRSLRDTSAVSLSIFGSLLSLKSIFVPKQKSNKWLVVSSLIHKGKTATLNEPQISNEALESHIAVIENSLNGIFRTLIKTRVSLLNIRSQ